ncbi:MAG: YdcF family protein [Proteobacteria bacterium]|jgi:uncharacterized SAM-binding protein YcdF (DUF218 family)|nr:YdcF family protein [Pseudomonadota bacterium]
MSLILIHHILQSFVLPPLNAIIIILIGVFILKKYQDVAKFFIITGCVLLYIQATPFFVYSFSGFFEKPQITLNELNKSQAIVVLGGGVKTNAYEYPEGFNLNSWTLMRLQYAAFLAKQNPQKLVIVSGGIASAGNHSEAQIMKETLQTTFNIKNPILIEEQSRNTNENAKFVTQMLQPLNINNVAIVSQAFHATRAIALFNKYNIHAVAASTDYMGHYTSKVTIASFIPNANTMLDCAQLLHELAGYIVYVKINN